jgi:hypothetical protein
MSRNSMRLILLTVIVVCTLAAALSLTTAPKASAASHVPSRAAATGLGGVNLRGYCQSLGYANVTTVGSTVYDWRCVRADGSLASFDMDSACNWQYEGRISFEDSVTARPGNFYSVTSINCYRYKRELGGPNLQGYCQSLGYNSVTTVGTTVYDWRCVGRGNQWILAGINMVNACTWTHVLYSLDIFYNFYDMTSINCIF